MSFFCSRTLSRRPCYIICHIPLNAFWLWQFLRLSLCGWPWPFWGVLVRCFVERPSTGVYHVFLMTRPGSLGFGRKTTGIRVPFHDTPPILPTIYVVHHWCWPWIPGWGGVFQVPPRWSSPPAPPLRTVLSGREGLWGAHLGWEVHLSPGGRSSCTNYLEFSCTALPLLLPSPIFKCIIWICIMTYKSSLYILDLY